MSLNTGITELKNVQVGEEGKRSSDGRWVLQAELVLNGI